jgi:hypothetical protein
VSRLNKKQRDALAFIGDGLALHDFALEYEGEAGMLLDVLKHAGLIDEEYSRKFNLTVLMPRQEKRDDT